MENSVLFGIVNLNIALCIWYFPNKTRILNNYIVHGVSQCCLANYPSLSFGGLAKNSANPIFPIVSLS